MTIAKNIKKLRKAHNLTQADFGRIAGVSDKAISTWENGTALPRMGAVQALADYFGIEKSDIIDDKPPQPPTRIPVYGSVPAGIPMEAIEDVIDFEDIPGHWLKSGKQYIALRVRGDSMIPKYQNNDTILVLLQPDCESGQDAIVRVNGYDATLKKVIKQPYGIMLQPLNPAYDPVMYEYSDVDNPVSILGIVVEIRRKV